GQPVSSGSKMFGRRTKQSNFRLLWLAFCRASTSSLLRLGRSDARATPNPKLVRRGTPRAEISRGRPRPGRCHGRRFMVNVQRYPGKLGRANLAAGELLDGSGHGLDGCTRCVQSEGKCADDSKIHAVAVRLRGADDGHADTDCERSCDGRTGATT